VHAAALRLMADRGFDAVSIDDIVAAAGVSRRTFFNYFAGKESVVFDPDPDDPALWAALLAARPAGEPLWTSLREALIGYTAAAADRLDLTINTARTVLPTSCPHWDADTGITGLHELIRTGFALVTPTPERITS
jgi:AcrR family transcriptional regulator